MVTPFLLLFCFLLFSIEGEGQGEKKQFFGGQSCASRSDVSGVCVCVVRLLLPSGGRFVGFCCWCFSYRLVLSSRSTVVAFFGGGIVLLIDTTSCLFVDFAVVLCSLWYVLHLARAPDNYVVNICCRQ